MYSANSTESKKTNSKEVSEAKGVAPQTPNVLVNEIDDLEKTTCIFADSLPEGIFTLAEIQGLLFTSKRVLKRALEEVEEWKENKHEEKKAKSKTE